MGKSSSSGCRICYGVYFDYLALEQTAGPGVFHGGAEHGVVCKAVHTFRQIRFATNKAKARAVTQRSWIFGYRVFYHLCARWSWGARVFHFCRNGGIIDVVGPDSVCENSRKSPDGSAGRSGGGLCP